MSTHKLFGPVIGQGSDGLASVGSTAFTTTSGQIDWTSGALGYSIVGFTVVILDQANNQVFYSSVASVTNSSVLVMSTPYLAAGDVTNAPWEICNNVFTPSSSGTGGGGGGGGTVPPPPPPNSGVPVNTVAPTVSGSTPYGSTLTAQNGTWTNSNGITFTYQWTSGGTNITGATGQTYTTLVGDVGNAIGVKVTAHNNVGSSASATASSNTITVTTPTTSGNASVGSIANGGTYSPSLDTSYAKLTGLITDLNGTAAPGNLPGIRNLFYRSACSVNTGYDTSIPWSTASANNWLLYDSSGNLLINSGYSSNNIGDISNPGFSTALGNNCVSWCQSYGYTGVWCDDVVAWCTELCSALPNGWSQTTWYNNMISHIGRVGAIMRAAGLDFICNASGYEPGNSGSDDGSLETSFWTALAQSGGPTGFTAEYWEQNDSDGSVRTTGTSSYLQFWDQWRALHTLCHNLGVQFVPNMYAAADTSECIYGRGTFLLDYNGDNSFYLSGDSPEGDDPYGSTWCKIPGAASGAATESPAGLWTRVFANTTVVVNSNTGTATIS